MQRLLLVCYRSPKKIKHNIKRAIAEYSVTAAVHATYTSAAQQDTCDLEEQEPPQCLPISDRDTQLYSKHSQLHKRNNLPV